MVHVVFGIVPSSLPRKAVVSLVGVADDLRGLVSTVGVNLVCPRGKCPGL